MKNTGNKNHKKYIYMLMQMVFWMAYCCCHGFVSYYLVEKGFSISVVGIVGAVVGIISAIGQPIVGAIADKSELGYKKPLMILMTLLISFGTLLIIASYINFVPGICLVYAIVMVILYTSTPLIHAAGVSYGNDINFGVARGMGSFGYATASYVMGYLTASLGPSVIPIAIIIFAFALIIVSGVMPKVDKKNIGGAKEKAVDERKEPSSSKKGFFTKYPAFTYLWVSFIFMLTVHCLSNTYLLQILEKGGGTSKHLGIAVAIAALMEIPMIVGYEKVSKWISTKNLLMLSAFTYVLKSVLQLLNSNLIVFYLIQMLQLTSWGVYASASVYYAKENIPVYDQNKAQAYMVNAQTIGTVIGTLVGGRLIDMYGVNAMLVFQCIMSAIGFAGITIWKYSKRIHHC